MKVKNRLAKLSSFFESAVVILISALFVCSIVYAATTIGSNISTDGNLDVNGTASSTNATTTGYLYIGQDITEPPGWDFGLGDLIATDDAFINGQATTSASLWVGSGTASGLNLDMSNDLYVKDDVQIGSSLWFDQGTTTDSLKIGGYASTTGDLIVGGGTFDLTTSTATTTNGLFIRTRGNTTATTTGLSIGSTEGDKVIGCIELVRPDGDYVKLYVGTGATTLSVSVGRCKDL